MLAGLAMYCGREHDTFTLRAGCEGGGGGGGLFRVRWASEGPRRGTEVWYNG